jgi:hypothetical protein
MPHRSHIDDAALPVFGGHHDSGLLVALGIECGYLSIHVRDARVQIA